MVGGCPVHIFALAAAPEVAAADDESNFHAHVVHFDYLVDDVGDDLLVKAVTGRAGKRLA